MTQYDAVVRAMERLGGVATLAQLYREVPRIEDCTWTTKTPQASIRRIVQLSDKIFKIKPGLYGLVSQRSDIEGRGIIQETKQNQDSPEVQLSNHTYYQGLLLLIGKYRTFNCWAPQQDRNKAFLNGTIDSARTIQQIPPFSYPNLVGRCETIDVVWFNGRGMPNSFFEVEFSTPMHASLLKFNDLQDFFAQMVIVAEDYRRKEFDEKLAYSAFSEIRKRVKFLDFESLVKRYELVVSQTQMDVLL
jgi:hypothetical protein